YSCDTTTFAALLLSFDSLLIAADSTLRTLSGASHAGRPCPVAIEPAPMLDDAQRRLSGALMRVNHVGEVCAQALYTAQALATRDDGPPLPFEHGAPAET